MKFYESFLFYIAIACLVLAPFGGYAAIALLILASFIFVADFVLRKLITRGWALRIAQICVLPAFFLLSYLPKSNRAVYLKVILPSEFAGDVSIFMGVPGAPPLESDTATIVVPPDGLFITSTNLGENIPLGTNLDQLDLAYYVLEAPASKISCRNIYSLDYRVSNIDSIRFVPDTNWHSRPHRFYDSLMQCCMKEAMQ